MNNPFSLRPTVNLYDFQVNGAKFMSDSEEVYSGSFMRDDCGLGKTIQTLKMLVEKTEKPTGTQNLIIVPSNLVENWLREIKNYTTINPDVNVTVYTGANRKKLDYTRPFIISSYALLAREYLESGNGTNRQFKGFSQMSVFSREFKRVIFDESHHIKNKDSKSTKGAMCIKTRFVHLLSATPILNNYDEIYPFLKLLKQIDNFSDFRTIYPKTNQGLEALQSLVESVSIARKKETTLELPRKNVKKVYLEFSPGEKEFYNAIFDYSHKRLEKMFEFNRRVNETRKKTYFQKALSKLHRKHILVFILRLRMCCSDPEYILRKMKRLVSNDLMSAVRELKKLTVENKDECPICMDALVEEESNCGHRCCSECWVQWKSQTSDAGFTCPICRSMLVWDSFKTLQTRGETSHFITSRVISTTKIEQTKIKYTLQRIKKVKDQNEKILIGTQWKSVLAKLKSALSHNGIKFIEISGDVPQSERASLIRSFNINNEIHVCLMSSSCSPEGINLVSANHVIIYEPYWNGGMSKQLQDRTHRIGQTREVWVEELGFKNSIEESLWEMGSHKSTLVSGMFQKSGYFNNMTLEFLKRAYLSYSKREI